VEDLEKLGRMKATNKAHEEFREPTEAELKGGASMESALWSARVSVPRTFYRAHAKPDFGRIALALLAGLAFFGFLYVFGRSRKTQRLA
jgi:hypothetical protein